jgi:hypothetical protein
MNAGYLLKALEKDVNGLLEELRELLGATEAQTWLIQPSPEKWSAAQVIEHLNSYNRYYIPQIQLAILRGRKKNGAGSSEFNPGWLGAYFTRIMKPTAQSTVAYKMQAPKDHRPVADLNLQKVLEEFKRQENLLVELLNESATINIGDVRVPISISKFIRLKLGDTFNFLIAHQRRHFIQLRRTLDSLHTPSGINLKQAVG